MGWLGSSVDRPAAPAPSVIDAGACRTEPTAAPLPQITFFYCDVNYRFRSLDHRVQMTSPPGSTVTVNRQGEPRG